MNPYEGLDLDDLQGDVEHLYLNDEELMETSYEMGIDEEL